MSEHKQSRDPKHVVISGAGPVGSLTALFFGQRGHRVDVYERREDLRQTGEAFGRSINLAMSDRGWKALDAAGVGDRLRERAIPMHGRVMHAKDGALSEQPYGKEGQFIYAIHRTELNNALLDFAEECGNVRIHFQRKAVGAKLKEATLVVEDEQGAQEEVRGDLLIGADGAGSAVRQAAMAQTPRMNYSQQWLEHGYKELRFPAVAGQSGDARFALKKNALHIWPRGEHMVIALPNLDGSFTGTFFFRFEGKESFAALDSVEKARAFFEAEYADALALMPSFEEDWERNPTSSLGIIRCQPWTWHDKVALIGDAAHPIVPFYGQGLVAGFEDVGVLGELIDAHEGDWGKIFAAYEAARRENANAIGTLALENFVEMRERVGDARFLLQKKIENKIAALFPGQYIPKYALVTFTHTPYAEALARGRAQEAFMQEIMAIEGVEERWESEAFEAVLRERTAAFLSAQER